MRNTGTAYKVNSGDYFVYTERENENEGRNI